LITTSLGVTKHVECMVVFIGVISTLHNNTNMLLTYAVNIVLLSNNGIC